jgi:hypothetical protein
LGSAASRTLPIYSIFGKEAVKPFETIWEVHSRIAFAAGGLIRTNRRYQQMLEGEGYEQMSEAWRKDKQRRERWEADIWAGWGDEDDELAKRSNQPL